MLIGIDAAFGGTEVNYQQAAAAGISWVGWYFGGAGAYRVWPNNEVQSLRASAIKYNLPIWVPAQSFASNPSVEANEAISKAITVNVKNVIALDVEHGSGATLAWLEAFGAVLVQHNYRFVMYHGGDKPVPSSAHSWLASWTGNAPTSLNRGMAQQYRGATNAFGMSVDFNAADEEFPLEGRTVNPPPPIPGGTRVPSQAIPEEIVQSDLTWQGTNNRLDVVMTGKSGKVYHKWWDGTGWHGPDVLTGAV